MQGSGYTSETIEGQNISLLYVFYLKADSNSNTGSSSHNIRHLSRAS